MVEWFDIETAHKATKDDPIWACPTGRPMRKTHWDERLGWVDEDSRPIKDVKWWRPIS